MELRVLCLSTGDADGLGRVRAKELVAACGALGIDHHHVHVLDHPRLRDGFRSVWPPDEVAAAVAEHVRQHGVDALLTFDARGVSGHPNHVAVHRGVRRFLARQADLPARSGGGGGGGRPQCAAGPAGGAVLGWELVSTSLPRKFAGLLDVLPSALLSVPARRPCFVTPDYPRATAAMALHASQFVWYRRLFVAFARYTYVNTLAPLLPEE